MLFGLGNRPTAAGCGGGRRSSDRPAILHVDTGMARLGLTPREFADFVRIGRRSRGAR